MQKYLRFEFDRLFRQKSFYICTGIGLILVIATSVASKIMSQGTFTQTAWSNVASNLNMTQFKLLASIFVTIFVCSDFAETTVKNIYSHGFSRKTVFIGKYISSLSAMIIMYAATMLTAFGIGLILGGFGKEDGAFGILVKRMLVMLAFHGFYFMISIIFNKAGNAIAINLIAFNIIDIILMFVDTAVFKDKINLSNYTLDSIMTRAIDTASTVSTSAKAILLAIVYCIVFIAVGFVINNRKEY